MQIGKAPREPRDLMGWLLDCHAKMREMTALTVRLASEPRPADEEIADAADRVRRYFKRSLPQHVRDEEESIRPRIEHQAKAALERMQDEHREHERDVSEIILACERLREHPDAWDYVRADLLARAERLHAEMGRHLDEEERDIFPFVAALDPAKQAEIAAEMQSRRASEGGGGGGGGRRRS